MAASEAAYKAAQTCSSDEIYLRDLGARFWKLTLQIISRYKSWLEANLPEGAAQAVQPALAAAAAQSSGVQRSASGVNLQRVSTPPP